MSKTIKKLLFIILLLTLIGIMSLILPKTVLGAIEMRIGNKTTIGRTSVQEGDLKEKVFCIEHGQDIWFGDNGLEVEVTGLIEFNNDILYINNEECNNIETKKAYKEAFAILTADLGNNRENHITSDSEKNNYLWHCISSHNSNKIFLFGNDGCNDWEKYQDGTKYSGIISKSSTCLYTGKIAILRPTDKQTSPQKLIYIGEPPITKKEIQPVKLKFNKQDFNEKYLQGATIKITGVENVSKISSDVLTIGEKEVTITPTNNTGNFKIKVQEIQSPTGYSQFDGEITLTVNYNPANGKFVSITDSTNTNYIPNINNNNSTVIIKNKSQIEKLTLLKQDSLRGTNMEGATFTITLENVESIGNFSVGGTKTGKIVLTGIKTGSNGLVIEDLVISDVNKEVKITIEETAVPKTDGTYEYRKIDGKIYITLKRNGNGYEAKATKDSTITDKEYDGTVNVNGHEISVTLKNVPIITLSGSVWLDGQTGIKDPIAPNGWRDYEYVGQGKGSYVRNKDGEYSGVGNGKGDFNKLEAEYRIPDVLVKLYNTQTKTEIAETRTDEQGRYEFNNIEQLNNGYGYQVRFYYDGINYYTIKKLPNAGESTAQEQDRQTFNNRFTTISNGKSNDGTPLTYEYKNNVSTLKVNIDGTNPASNQKNFRMRADTDKFNETRKDLHCGLIKKEFDIGLTTSVKNVEVLINGAKTTYTYDGENVSIGSDDNVEINDEAYLYESDYTYRKKDYITDNIISNSENIQGSEIAGEELEVYVTYRISLEEGTYQDATVDEFVYYYDKNYTPDFKEGDTVEGYKVKEIIDKDNKITFELVDNAKKVGNGITLELAFKVNKDAKGNVITGAFKNAGEITKYSTEGGLIDKDSAPGNAEIKYNNVTLDHDEDDSDICSINIKIKEKATRKISGTVFEDTDKNGKLDEDKDKLVSDAIVQLIEIKEDTNSGNRYEYIWQEHQTDANGQYEFEGYIPSSGVLPNGKGIKSCGYIIRYIYGDGTTYDVTDAVKTYNGQDYKSTIDAHYTSPWYNTAGYTAGQSVARDNEARRLEVMAYSSTIDATNGEALERRNKDDLQNTWMCAETSLINVPVDADEISDGIESTKVKETTVNPKNVTAIEFKHMNFGLALRPETSISLEKHITGLKITPNGVGVQSVVDANADIKQIIKEDSIDTDGVKQGLSTIKSTRDERGFWQVATDVEELAQGAQLEVEYTYVIKNDGEQDYLSKTLVDKYTENPENYGSYLTNTAADVKAKTKGHTDTYGTYLGKFYYTGDSNGCALVPTRIETNGLEEAINNSLVFDSGDDFAKANENVAKNVYDTNGNPIQETITTVVQSTETSKYLIPEIDKNEYTENNTDYNKTITLRTVLSSTNGGELGANIPSYIAEIVKYSNAAGRRNMSAEPANLSYVHSDDKEMTLNNSWLYEKDGKTYETQNKENIPEGATNTREANEVDEFWGETIIIGKPTGGNNITPMQIAIITISSIAVLGAGIILIKKFVLKK